MALIVDHTFLGSGILHTFIIVAEIWLLSYAYEFKAHDQ